MKNDPDPYDLTAIERFALDRALARCNLSDYPEVVGDQQGDRADGRCVCVTCGHEFRDHPLDHRIHGYQGAFLHILCDGRRVKL